MKVGLYTPYLATMGGGERYVLTAAEFFLRGGNETFLFTDAEPSRQEINDRFNLDLTGLRFCRNVFRSDVPIWVRAAGTRNYDLLFYLSDGSIPLSLARKNILHFQRPFTFNGQSGVNKLKLSGYQAVVCNSQFTKKYIDRCFGISSQVLYPPVDIAKFTPGRKENLILSVGRFFAPSNPKRQDILVETFKKIVAKIPGWRLLLLGGIFGSSQKDIDDLRKKARGFPIEIDTDASFSKLRQAYSKAKIFWHATGYGQDLVSHPELAEHFGIVTVEAMASGCLPVVFSGGGQIEIISDALNGYLWKTTRELENITLSVIKNYVKRETVVENARIRSKDFSKDNFYAGLSRLI